jgi:hypothetical protein
MGDRSVTGLFDVMSASNWLNLTSPTADPIRGRPTGASRTFLPCGRAWKARGENPLGVARAAGRYHLAFIGGGVTGAWSCTQPASPGGTHHDVSALRQGVCQPYGRPPG